MRIISGKFKGKTIQFFKSSKTRPLKDSVKENIFNVLQHSNKINVNIENSNVLDLYSGIGSFGLECISRNAKKVTFIENNIVAINILKENLKYLSAVDRAVLISEKIENFLKEKIENKFQIFFLDPPFTDDKFISNLQLIKQKKIYTKKHVVIIHREKHSEDKINKFLTTVNVKKYGRSKIIFGEFN